MCHRRFSRKRKRKVNHEKEERLEKTGMEEED